MKLEIDEQLAQSILDYLAKRPYNEVYVLVARIQQLKQIQEIPPEPEPQKK